LGALGTLLGRQRIAPPLAGDYISPNLEELRSRLKTRSQAYVLDLGPMCAANLRLLLEQNCYVHCEHPTEALGALVSAPDQRDSTAAVVLRYRFPPAFFDAVLLWDLYDFLAAAEARRFSSSLRGALAPEGLIHALLRPIGSAGRAQPHRFQLHQQQNRFSATAFEATVLKHYTHRELRPLFPSFLLRRRTHHPGSFRDLLLSAAQGRSS
jgi:hypothetical protein